MKQSCLVWLPPDGDSRLTALQDALAEATQRPELGVRPPHLVLPEGLVRPSFEMCSGRWVEDDGLFVEIYEQGRWLGNLRLAETWGPPPPALTLGDAPKWVWRRGKLAHMVVEQTGGSLCWSFEPVSGWKASASTAPTR